MKHGLLQWGAQTVCQHEAPESPIMQERCTQHAKAMHVIIIIITRLFQKGEQAESENISVFKCCV